MQLQYLKNRANLAPSDSVGLSLFQGDRFKKVLFPIIRHEDPVKKGVRSGPGLCNFY